jgi:hypothetical protein
MSYINFKLLNSRGLTPNEFMFLLAAKTNKVEDNSSIIEYHFKDVLSKFKDTNLITFVKSKNKSENDYNTVRLTSLGNEWIDDLTTTDIIEDDIKLFNWLEGVYKSMDKEAGNKRKCRNFIAQFRVNSGICKNHLAFLCQTFINDEKEIEFSQKLEFLFFKGANLFSTKFDIFQSRLFQYYEKRKEFFEEQFNKIKNE